MNSVPIGFYDDGFKIMDLSCVDIPIAAACGTFAYNNYFYYSALYILNMNYYHLNDWHHLHENALAPLGLKLLKFKISGFTNQELYNLISQQIACMNPVLFVVKESLAYYVVPEDDGFYNNYHGVIISGTDSTNDTLQINDCTMQIELNSRYMPGQAFTRLRLRQRDVIEIVRASISSWEYGKLEKYAYLFSIEKSESIAVTSWKSLLEYWLNNFDYQQNIIMLELLSFNSHMDRYSEYDYVYDIRNTSCIIIKPLFTILMMILSEYQLSSVTINELKNAEKNIKKVHSNAVSIMQKYGLKHKTLPSQLMADLKKSVLNENRNLFNLATLILNELISFGENLTLSSKLEADSEQMLPNKIVRNVDNLISGSNKDWIVDSWQSLENEGPHWIFIDFLKSVKIKRIILRHLAINLITDYTILVSTNNCDWIPYATVADNSLYITCHSNSVVCRYLKFITPQKPHRYSAALWAFDVFGEAQVE